MGIRVHGLGASLSTVPTAAYTAIPLASVLADTDPVSMWAAANPTRLTVQVAGVYALSAHLGFVANATGVRSIAIRLNGVTLLSIMTVAALTLASGDTELSTATVWPGAVVGDYFELMGFQSSGAALAPFVAAEYSPALAAVMITQS